MARRRLGWSRQRVGGQGFAYNTDGMINSPRCSGRTRKITTVAQSHGALHEERAGGLKRAEMLQQVQGLKERRMLRMNGTFCQVQPVQAALVPHRRRRRSHSRSAMVEHGLGGWALLYTSLFTLTVLAS